MLSFMESLFHRPDLRSRARPSRAGGNASGSTIPKYHQSSLLALVMGMERGPTLPRGGHTIGVHASNIVGYAISTEGSCYELPLMLPVLTMPPLSSP